MVLSSADLDGAFDVCLLSVDEEEFVAVTCLQFVSSFSDANKRKALKVLTFSVIHAKIREMKHCSICFLMWKMQMTEATASRYHKDI
jgi:hypothetical protein